jgi:hypothetical protein
MRRSEQYSGGKLHHSEVAAKFISKKTVKYDFSEYDKLTRPEKRKVDLLLAKVPTSIFESGKACAANTYCDNHGLDSDYVDFALRMHGV